MKIRNGFVSNSSSSSFVVKIDEENKHLFHYDWKVKKEEILHGEDDETYIWKKEDLLRVNKKKWLEENNYNLDREETGFWCKYNPENKVYSKVDAIEKITGYNLGRYTGIAIGKDILDFLNRLKEDDWSIDEVTKIESLIKEHGIDNLALLRESDEGYCGYLPKELSELAKEALYEWEYH